MPIVCINWLKDPNLPTRDGGDIELIYTGIIAVEIPITKPSIKRAHKSIENYNSIIYTKIAHIPIKSIINKPSS